MTSLYPAEGAHWCSEADYRHVLHIARSHGARRVLEFGPGTTTLALVEAGATQVDTCEDDPHWTTIARERIESRFPDIIRVRPYKWAPVLCIPDCDGQRYDLAVIDGPAETGKREPAILYAIAHADRVLVALEDESTPNLWATVGRLAGFFGMDVRIANTGPLAGSYALIGPAC